ncbi:hypothetical protein [Staphylococcus epidermidis]|uniref:hypothetical protein n=1 Tax=Staphylococcus epidermidis TaxID=1282 RepID=UPI001643422D|nr:hypothetical protein [Staphylococcus epidermidis]
MVSEIVFDEVADCVWVYIGYMVEYLVWMNVERNDKEVRFVKEFFVKVERVYVDLLEGV